MFSFDENLQTMEKAKHTVGDPIHVKLGYMDNEVAEVSMRYYGVVTAARLHSGTVFPDRILYDVSLEQRDAENIIITNLPKGFVLAGGPEVEGNELQEQEICEAEQKTFWHMKEMCIQSLPPDVYEKWIDVSSFLRANRKALEDKLSEEPNK